MSALQGASISCVECCCRRHAYVQSFAARRSTTDCGGSVKHGTPAALKNGLPGEMGISVVSARTGCVGQSG